MLSQASEHKKEGNKLTAKPVKKSIFPRSLLSSTKMLKLHRLLSSTPIHL